MRRDASTAARVAGCVPCETAGSITEAGSDPLPNVSIPKTRARISKQEQGFSACPAPSTRSAIWRRCSIPSAADLDREARRAACDRPDPHAHTPADQKRTHAGLPVDRRRRSATQKASPRATVTAALRNARSAHSSHGWGREAHQGIRRCDGEAPNVRHVLQAIRSTRPLSILMSEKIEELRAWARERTVPADRTIGACREPRAVLKARPRRSLPPTPRCPGRR